MSSRFSKRSVWTASPAEERFQQRFLQSGKRSGEAGRQLGVELGEKAESVVDGRAVERLYRTRSGHLIGLAHWVVGSRAHAEEIVHDVFSNLVARPPRLRSEDKLEAYVRRAVVNGGHSHIRRRALERRKAAAVPESAFDHHVDAHVREAVRELPLRQRQCVVLRFYEDLTVDEIARTLALRPGTVKAHLHRAMGNLEKRLRKGAD